MTITNIRIRPVSDEPRLKGYATIVFDDELAVNECKIIEAKRGLCVEFPKDKYAKERDSESIVPLDRRTRQYIEALVLKAYRLGGDYVLREA